jgi:hypothetical protein
VAPLPTFVADRLDPATSPDPVAASGDAVVAGGLTEAETARLAVRRGFGPESAGSFVPGGENRTYCEINPPVCIGVAVATTAIVVATDDDSDS